jgi:hypothetical protein
MLPGSDLECDAEEIWGARCGLLHTLTAESNMSRNRGVRMINYIGTVQSAEEMQRRHEARRDTDIFVPTPRFVEAFMTGCERFEAKVRADADLRERVFFHAQSAVVAVD